LPTALHNSVFSLYGQNEQFHLLGFALNIVSLYEPSKLKALFIKSSKFLVALFTLFLPDAGVKVCILF